MGQLSCTKPESDSDINRYSLTISKVETGSGEYQQAASLSDKYLLGKQMKIGKNHELEKIWKEKLATFQCYVGRQSNYENSLSINVHNQLDQESLLQLEQLDSQMLHFFVQEKQGFRNFGLLGIPQEYRWSYWKIITLQNNINKKGIADNETTYCITKDINRTLIATAFKDEEVVKKLDDVLNAIASRFPKVGYCQGMNYLAALLLMVSGANEKESIRVFASMINSPFYLLNLMYQNDLPLLFILESIILNIISVRIPKLSQHFICSDIPTSFWLSKILLSGFVYLFSVRDCVLFWDYILIRGTVKGFAELVLAMMELYQKQLLLMDQAQIAEFFSFQESRGAEEVIKKAIHNKKIDSKEIRKIMHSDNSPMGMLFQTFDTPDFDQNYKLFSKR